jgi:hypothetical protein
VHTFAHFFGIKGALLPHRRSNAMGDAVNENRWFRHVQHDVALVTAESSVTGQAP